MEDFLYKIEHLNCAYDGKTIVLMIDKLEIPQNKVIFIVGSSGVGKSTILETLGLMNDTIVSVDKFFYKDQDLSKSWGWEDVEMSNFRNKEFSFVFQQNNLMPNFSAHDNIITAALFQGENERVARKKTIELLRVLDLPVEDRPIVEYSGGQKQRIAFARAILPSFTVLFGDEPTGNLDAKTAKNIMKMVVELTRQKGATAILVSHDMSLAVEFADEIIQIKKVINPFDKEKEKKKEIGCIDETCKYKKVGTTWFNNEVEFTKEELSLKLLEDL